MKTLSLSAKLFQIPFLTTLMIAATFVTSTMFGQVAMPTPVITFTEHSDTNLTATYTNSSGLTTNLTVTANPFFAADAWIVDTSPVVPTGVYDWSEPGGGSNRVEAITSRFFVFSDNFGPGLSSNNEISTVPIAVDNSTGSSVYGIFNDLGDTAAVPDTGRTASLLGFSLVGLAFLRRKMTC